MPKTLDKNRDYGQVFGKPGIDYEQDNCFFNLAGKEVTYDGDVIAEEAKKAKPEEGDNASKPVSDQFESMNAAELKTLVESYDGVYKNKDEAKAYLRGQVSKAA